MQHFACSGRGWENVQGLYTLQNSQRTPPRGIVDHIRVTGGRPSHTVQTQHTVAFLSLLASHGKNTQQGGGTDSNRWLAYRLTYMHPHSITPLPKTANLHAASQGGFQPQCK